MARNLFARFFFALLGIIIAIGVILFIITGFFILFFIGSLVLLAAILFIGPMILIRKIRGRKKVIVIPPEKHEKQEKNDKLQ